MAKFNNNLQKVLLIAILVIATLLSAIPMNGQAAAASTTYKVNTSDLNVRSGPSTKYKVLFKVQKNTTVTKVSTSGTWYKIKSGTKTGFASSKYLTQVKTATVVTTTTPKQTTYFYVTEPTGLTMRTGAASTNKSTGVSVPFEAKVQILKENKNGWIQTKYNNTTGWINANVLYGFKSTVSLTYTTTKNVEKEYLVMQGDSLNVRKIPNVIAPSLGKIGKGFTAEILRTASNGWVEIQFSASERGWVSSNTNLSIVTKSVEKVSEIAHTLNGLSFVIDAGHGGSDPGAGGRDLNGKFITEASLALKTAQVMKEAIEKLGGQVYMTRESDVHLSANKNTDLGLRAKFASTKNANAFISVHYNSASVSTASGYETLYYTSTSKEFANTIHENVIDAIQEEYTSYKDRKLKFQNVMVLRENTVFATLIELGFMSSPTELTLMNSNKFRGVVSEGVVNGLLEYYGR